MKRLLIILMALIMSVSAFFGCAKDSGDNNIGKDGSKPVSEITSDDETVGKTEYPIDVLEGLPYTLVCRDQNTNEVIDFDFGDEGRLNDGLYRSENDLLNGTGEEMRVEINGSSQYNYEITFEADGQYDGYRFIVHNSDLKFSFLKIEMGEDKDHLAEIDYEDDFEITENMHCDDYADFKVTNIKTVRVTFCTGTSSSVSFDEVSLMGVLKGQSIVTETETETEAETTAPESGNTDPRLYGYWTAYDPELLEENGRESIAAMRFNSDGTGIFVQEGFNLPLTWYTENNVLYMHVALAGMLEKPYYFKDGYLFLNDEDGRLTQFQKNPD